MKALFFSLIGLFIVGCGSSSGGGTTSTPGCSTDSCGYCETQRVGVRICSFVATPTSSESVTLINYTTSTVSLNNYTNWDLNAWSNGSGQKTLGAGDSLTSGATATFSSLPFGINDSGETIYLKDS